MLGCGFLSDIRFFLILYNKTKFGTKRLTVLV